MRFTQLALITLLSVAFWSTTGCKGAKYDLLKKEKVKEKENPVDGGPQEVDPDEDFRIEGPIEGKPDDTLTYNGVNCEKPDEIVWTVAGDDTKTGTGPTFDVSFERAGEYTIQARCGEEEDSITVIIKDPEDPGDGNQNQNQNQNQNGSQSKNN
jgi:hypothetical protein